MLKPLKEHPRFILFTFLACLFSGPGQTYFLSLLTVPIEQDYGISRVALSSCFSIATFSSAFLLPFVGKGLDHYSFKSMSIFSGVLLSVGYLVMFFGHSIASLYLAYLLIKTFGQGGMTITYTTIVSKLFGKNRGKVLAMANLGHPVGQVLFPPLLVSILFHMGTKTTFLFVSLLVLVIFVFSSFLILPSENPKTSFYQEMDIDERSITKIEKRFFKDWRFYLISYGNIMAPLLVSGMFFHQDRILGFKGWGIEAFTFGMMIFALSQFLSNFLTGYLIDRFSATRLIHIGLAPLFFALIIFKFGHNVWYCYLFFFLAGLSAVSTGTIKGIMWSELYELNKIGHIRGWDLKFNIIAAGIGPLLFALLLDYNFSINALLVLLIVMSLTGMLAQFISRNSYLRVL